MAVRYFEATSAADARALGEAGEAAGLWIGGPAAGALVEAVGPRARMLPDLAAIVPALGPARL